jgi:hypothetical protein
VDHNPTHLAQHSSEQRTISKQAKAPCHQKKKKKTEARISTQSPRCPISLSGDHARILTQRMILFILFPWPGVVWLRAVGAAHQTRRQSKPPLVSSVPCDVQMRTRLAARGAIMSCFRPPDRVKFRRWDRILYGMVCTGAKQKGLHG